MMGVATECARALAYSERTRRIVRKRRGVDVASGSGLCSGRRGKSRGRA